MSQGTNVLRFNDVVRSRASSVVAPKDAGQSTLCSPPKFKMADLRASMGAVSDKKKGCKSRGNMDIGGLPQGKIGNKRAQKTKVLGN